MFPAWLDSFSGGRCSSARATGPTTPTQESHLEQLLLQEWGRYDGSTRSSLKGAIAQSALHRPVAHTDPSFQAIMLLFMGAYCSADCYCDFWDVDHVLAQWLIPAWQRAAQLITTVEAPRPYPQTPAALNPVAPSPAIC